MTTLLEIQRAAMQLPEDERAKLASVLLCSLPSVLHDEDDGVAEALRRDAELDRDPSKGMTLDEFRSEFES
jgi:putative addiction module component (TIGR02574 family)